MGIEVYESSAIITDCVIVDDGHIGGIKVENSRGVHVSRTSVLNSCAHGFEIKQSKATFKDCTSLYALMHGYSVKDRIGENSLSDIKFENCSAAGNGRDGFNVSVQANLFDDMESAVADSDVNSATKEELLSAIATLKKDLTTKSLTESYESFVANVGAHISIFSLILPTLLQI